jgi:putative mRNA 3-end processing factor
LRKPGARRGAQGYAEDRNPRRIPALIKPESLLHPRPEGLYCPPGDFYIDPVAQVARAVITHGHADHARAGHGEVLATPATLDIMRERYGEAFADRVQPAPYGEVTARDGVEVSLVPAGHVLGSAQAVVAWKGLTIVVSGDYKRQPDPTCAAFEPVPCEVFVTEATFALPVFRHPPAVDEAARLVASALQFPERTHLVGAYALGKAQRLICLLRQTGWERPIHVHGALERLNALYERHGVDLGPLIPTAGEGRHALPGEIVIAPPSAIADRWSRRFADPVTAFASGWMRVRARARQRAVELPLIISDHADWDELTATAREIAPGELWITHGREEALARWAELNGLAARPLSLVGYEDEDA